MEARKFVEKLFSYYTQGEMQGFFSCFDPHAVWKVHGNHPYAGEYKTIANLENIFSQFYDFIQGKPKQNLRHLIVEGNKAAAFLYDEVVGKDGKTYTLDYTMLLEVAKDGKSVVFVDSYIDGEQILEVIRASCRRAQVA
ncbi:MAG: nuclear transport factor 2 family protein [Chlamydiota bacterium]